MTTVQTCTVHAVRAAMWFVSYADRRKIAAALKLIYAASTADAVPNELNAFAAPDLGNRYPAAVMTWENAWERFIPFLEFIRRFARLSRTGALPQQRRDHQIALAGDPGYRRQTTATSYRERPAISRTPRIAKLVEGAGIQGWKKLSILS